GQARGGAPRAARRVLRRRQARARQAGRGADLAVAAGVGGEDAGRVSPAAASRGSPEMTLGGGTRAAARVAVVAACAAAATTLTAAAPAAAEPVTLRMASVTPDGSAWARELRAAGREIAAGTHEQVL